jgi:hypothetical protein
MRDRASPVQGDNATYLRLARVARLNPYLLIPSMVTLSSPRTHAPHLVRPTTPSPIITTQSCLPTTQYTTSVIRFKRMPPRPNHWFSTPQNHTTPHHPRLAGTALDGPRRSSTCHPPPSRQAHAHRDGVMSSIHTHLERSNRTIGPGSALATGYTWRAVAGFASGYAILYGCCAQIRNKLIERLAGANVPMTAKRGRRRAKWCLTNEAVAPLLYGRDGWVGCMTRARWPIARSIARRDKSDGDRSEATSGTGTAVGDLRSTICPEDITATATPQRTRLELHHNVDCDHFE